MSLLCLLLIFLPLPSICLAAPVQFEESAHKGLHPLPTPQPVGCKCPRGFQAGHDGCVRHEYVPKESVCPFSSVPGASGLCLQPVITTAECGPDSVSGPSAGTCLTRVTVEPYVSCPWGAIVNGKCILISVYEGVLRCEPHAAVAGNQCQSMTITDAQYTCPDETQIFRGKCYQTLTVGSLPECQPGYTLDGNLCTAVERARPLLSCDTSATDAKVPARRRSFNDHPVERAEGACRVPVIHPCGQAPAASHLFSAKRRLASPDTSEANGERVDLAHKTQSSDRGEMCHSELYRPGWWICPPGFDRKIASVSKGKLHASKWMPPIECLATKQVVPSFRCPVTLINGKCQTVLEVPGVYTCGDGYSLVGSKCTQVTDEDVDIEFIAIDGPFSGINKIEVSVSENPVCPEGYTLASQTEDGTIIPYQNRDSWDLVISITPEVRQSGNGVPICFKDIVSSQAKCEAHEYEFDGQCYIDAMVVTRCPKGGWPTASREGSCLVDTHHPLICPEYKYKK
eukprot:GHVT01088268.1.p1 GENE.GHVT01088268.1~~GHVT01088268.1.p1  ORF type:complete len:545 (+),score=39.23 GHVT01088268.1:101-1636(+)